jgi:hypothetical protein
MAIPQLGKKAQTNICQYVKDAYTLWDSQSRRPYMAHIDRQYARRLDHTSESLKAQVAAFNADPTKFRNMIYPIIMPQVEAAVAYQAEVYCAGVPLFPVVTPPQHAEAGGMLETVLNAQAERGAWGTEFTKSFRDAFKYNLCGTVADWEIQMVPLAGIPAKGEDNSRKVAWQGNVIKRLDMYNTFFDVRVAPHEVASKGEFAGYIELMPRTQLRMLIASLSSSLPQNVQPAVTSSRGGNFGKKYHVPNLGTTIARGAAVTQQIDWMSHFNLRALDGRGNDLGAVGEIFEVVTAYIRICPVDFGFTPAAATLPQVFKCIIVNWEHLIHFSPVTTELGDLPVYLSHAYEDGLGNATGSLAENIEDIQQLASAFLNSAIAARRRSVGDRAIFNSSLIDPRDLEGDSPVAKIRMKANAMAAGMKPSDAYFPIPFNDNISGTAMQDATMIERMGYGVGGQNPAKQGQFQKGNRSRAEFNSVMDFSTSRDRMCALHFESRLFTPVKRRLKYNVVQNQGPEYLFSRSSQKLVKVEPAQLQAAVMEFKVGDGLTPAAKLADADTLQVALQTLQAVPQLQQEYPMGEVFASILRAGGMDISEYRYTEEQRAYNQQLAAWQQQATLAAEKGVAFDVPMPQQAQPAQAQQPQ